MSPLGRNHAQICHSWARPDSGTGYQADDPGIYHNRKVPLDISSVDGVIIGLRSDGVVVWRKIEETEAK